MLGKQPIVLADADAIVDSMDLANTFLSNDDADKIAQTSGASAAIDLARTVKSDFVRLVQTQWDQISEHARQSVYWTHSSSDQDEEIKKRRSAFTAMFLGTDFSDAPDWVAMRDRFNVVLNLFESQGCFVLRRGTIESYYADEANVSGDSKPAGATSEAMAMSDKNSSELELQFEDILRGLRYAASVEPLNEVELIRDTLLAVVAPAIARIRTGERDVDLNALGAATLGDAAQLFNMQLKTDAIEIHLQSKTLEIDAFPMQVSTKSDLIDQVNEKLNIEVD